MAQALVLALVVAGTSAFTLLHKSVTLDVDGSVITVSAFGRTVGDVLSAQRVRIGERDVVVPDLDAPVFDDGEIVVRHGREIVVEIDGTERTVWTTALTVGDVVAEMGLRADVRTSASRSQALGRDMLRLSTVKTVNVSVDGTTTEVRTAAATAREVLQSAGVVLGPHDLVSVGLDNSPVDGGAMVVTRVATVVRSQILTQAFETVRQDDEEMTKGREVVSTEGRDGRHSVTYESYEADGVEVGRTVLVETVLQTPVTKVVRVGTSTGPDLSSVAPVEPGTSREIALGQVLARGWGESEFACLDSLWSKESGWRVNAHNASSGAYGIPQSLPGSKMASAGADWQTNPATQITWGLGYIAGRYGTPCGAWSASQVKGWY